MPTKVDTKPTLFVPSTNFVNVAHDYFPLKALPQSAYVHKSKIVFNQY